MKNYFFLVFVLLLSYSYEAISQTICLANDSLKIIENRQNGFNLARQWGGSMSKSNGGYSGKVDNDLVLQTKEINPNIVRFPGGGLADGYHRNRKGYGLRIDEQDLSFAQYTDPANTNAGYPSSLDGNATNPSNLFSSYPGWNNPAESNGNIIFPFMKFVNDINIGRAANEQTKVLFVLNIVPHFCFHDDLRYELFNKITTINNITSLTQVNTSTFSQAFCDLVHENIAAINQLNAGTGNSVVGVELGNEFYNARFRSDVATLNSFTKTNTSLSERKDLHLKLWSVADPNTIKYYAGLVKMYSRLIKEVNSSIKIGVPLGNKGTAGGSLTVDPNQKKWNDYIISNCANFADAYIIHLYFAEYTPGSGPANNNSITLGNEFGACNTSINSFLSDNVNYLSALKPLNKKVWITEWEIKMDDNLEDNNRRKFGNTLLQAMFMFDEILSFLDLNKASANAGFIEYSCHHVLNNNSLGNAESPTYELVNIPYNTSASPNRQRTTYEATKLLLPLFKPGIKVIKNPEIILPTETSNFKTRMFFLPGMSTGDAGTVYLFYENKTGSNQTVDLHNIMFSGIGNYALTSIYHNALSANNFYASRGRTSFRSSENLSTNGDSTVQITNEARTLASLTNFNFAKFSFGYLSFKLTNNATESNTLDISTPEEAAIDAFPNPNDGQFIVRHSTEHKYLEVYNETGQIVIQKSMDFGTETPIDISDEPSGFYFVKIDGAKTLRIVKK